MKRREFIKLSAVPFIPFGFSGESPDAVPYMRASDWKVMGGVRHDTLSYVEGGGWKLKEGELEWIYPDSKDDRKPDPTDT